MADRQIFFTLNLTDPTMMGKEQVIHIEMNDEKNANFVITGIFKSKKGTSPKAYTISQMKLELIDICGQPYALGALSQIKDVYYLEVLKSNERVSKHTYEVNINLEVGRLFNLEISYVPIQNNQGGLKVGTRVCDIKVG